MFVLKLSEGGEEIGITKQLGREVSSFLAIYSEAVGECKLLVMEELVGGREQ